MIAASIAHMREAARKRLPHFLFEYIEGGSFTETTLERNIQDLRSISLRQRVLQDVSELDLSWQFFGHRYALPVILGPVGLAGMTARRGECQAVRAAESAGVPFTLSTVSVCSLDEVASAASKAFWLQLYMTRDRGFVRELLQRAVEVGCSALVFTVDMPVPGIRYRDYRSGLAGAPGLLGHVRRYWQGALKQRWAWDVGVMGRPHGLGNLVSRLEGKTGLEDFFAWMGTNFDSSISWRDLDFIRSEWKGPLVIKGILDPDDAREAASIGADAVVVSNHGGRQLDGVPSTCAALPAIVDAVGHRLTLLIDGGVRSGLDVIRLLALGADGVMLGRAWVYALAAAGQLGVEQMLRTMESEMRVAMTLAGVNSLEEIDQSVLVRKF